MEANQLANLSSAQKDEIMQTVQAQVALANMQELVGKLGGGELNNMNNIKLGGDLVGKNLNNIVGNLWKQQEEGSGSSHGNMVS